MNRTKRITAYFEDLAKSLPEGLDPAGEQATKRRKIGTILDVAGASRSSEKLRLELADAAASAGLLTDVPLASPGVGQDAWVRFSRTEFPPPSIQPPTEKAFREWILHNIEIGAGGALTGLYSVRREFTIPGTKRRVDVLAQERNSTGGFMQWVIIEIEKSSPTGAVKQLVAYMDAFQKSPMADRRPVRGIVISPDPAPREAALFAAYPEHELSWYHLDCRLELDAEQRPTAG